MPPESFYFEVAPGSNPSVPHCIRFIVHPGSVRIGIVAIQFANRLSLIAFSTSSLRSAIGGTGFESGIQEALAALAIFYVLGLVLGELARRLVEENAQIEVERLFAELTEEQSPNPTVSS